MKLFEESHIGNLTLKNRIFMAPMGPELGDFNEQTNAYYAERAKGGAALLMINVLATTEFDGPSPSSLLNQQSFEGFKQLVEACHRYGSKVCIQIMPGVGLGGMGEGREIPASASAVPLYPGAEYSFAELTKEEIQTIQSAVQKSLTLAAAAGVDAIEIHAYGGYLTDRFLTKKWNIRTDEYGGTLTNRLRFLDEIIEQTQQNVGKDFPLFVKYTPTHLLPAELGYRDLLEGIEIAKHLEAKGIHALHVDVGCHDNWNLAMPTIYQSELAPQISVAQKIKQEVGIPVISNGHLGDISRSKTAVDRDWLDYVAVGRQFLADPHFVNKIQEGKAESVRPCIYCNSCIENVTKGKPIGCAVNALTGKEYLFRQPLVSETGAKQRMLVIGAGPGGCSAALFAKEWGFDVEIWEKENMIGGNFFNACQPPFKREGSKLLTYYAVQLAEKNIPVRLNQEATLQKIQAGKFDKVLYAAGGKPIKPQQIPGIDLPHVSSANEVLQNRNLNSDQVVVIGGGLVGCELALTESLKGNHVTIVEMQEKLLPENEFIQNEMQLMTMLNKADITVLTQHKLIEITEDSVFLENDGQIVQIEAGLVVLALGFKPADCLFEQLVAAGINVTNIGDSRQIGKVYQAVHQAHEIVCGF